MNNWINISGRSYYVAECDVQLSIERWATIHIVLDIATHTSYYGDFIDLYENRSSFQINTRKFFASNCRIKSMDIEFDKKMAMSIRCENIDTHDISVRREGIIDDLLDNEGKTLSYLKV